MISRCKVGALMMSCIMFVGCSSVSNISEIPLVPALSQKEVVDYYKTSLEYDTVAYRTLKPNNVTYEVMEVVSNREEIEAKALAIQGLLNYSNYETWFGFPQGVFEYIKYVIDDKQLINGKTIAINEALGYYFVDIEYNFSELGTGQFTDNLRYIGINGSLKQDTNGNISVDYSFMNKANTDVNNYLAENTEYKSPVVVGSGVRSPLIDVGLYNKAAGMSLNQTAIMPNLNMIYYAPASGALIYGYGIYPEGAFSLREFGYNRAELNGTVVLRYVFKRDLMDLSLVEFKNVYPVSIKLSNDVKADETVVVPDFIINEMEKLLERADRAISNNDLTALMNGRIFEDVGIAIRYANMQKFVYNTRNMSKVVKALGRNNNSYLFEFETIVQEGVKGTNGVGAYKLGGYMVMQQSGTEFHITDFLIKNREMMTEPQINLDSTIYKRLAALNLSGEVNEQTKTDIKQLMVSLYTASTERKLQNMYDCFNNDTNLLSSTHKEYLNSQLRGWLTKYGSNVKSEYIGVVTQWIGGNDNQVEFFTDEIIIYEGRSEAQFMSTYYLVSSYEDRWVIDESKLVESKIVSGEEKNNIIDIIRSGRSIGITNPDNKLVEETKSQENQENEAFEENEDELGNNEEEESGVVETEGTEGTENESNISDEATNVEDRGNEDTVNQ